MAVIAHGQFTRRMPPASLDISLWARFTFAGGADYILWKIERHTGRQVQLTAWQRRHPLLAAPLVLWRLRSGRTAR